MYKTKFRRRLCRNRRILPPELRFELRGISRQACGAPRQPTKIKGSYVRNTTGVIGVARVKEHTRSEGGWFAALRSSLSAVARIAEPLSQSACTARVKRSSLQLPPDVRELTRPFLPNAGQHFRGVVKLCDEASRAAQVTTCLPNWKIPWLVLFPSKSWLG